MTDNSRAPTKSLKMCARWNKNASRYIGALAVIVLALGTVVYHIIEDWAWVDSFSFSTVAIVETRNKRTSGTVLSSRENPVRMASF
jgi:hypothetical protein